MEQQEVLQYKITGKPRPLRLLFLVEEGYDIAHLKKIILTNLQFWGGRYNPIVPLNKAGLKTGWEKFFSIQDPDYIYITSGIGMDVAKLLCDTYGLNPIEIVIVGDNLHDIKGVHHANLMPVINSKVLLQPVNLWEVDSPLKEYYKLNFLLNDTISVTRGLFANHQLLPVYHKNYDQINELIARPFVNNNSILSSQNTRAGKIRPENATYHHLELLIAADHAGFEELLYHWNKPAYELTPRELLTIYLTKTELELLVLDGQFKNALKKLSEDNSKIQLVSFSLARAELDELAEKLIQSCTLNRFEVKEVNDFPYPIVEVRSNYQDVITEKESIQVIFKNQNFVFFPPLSFDLAFKPFSQAYGLDLKINELRGPHNQTLRFPLKLITDFFTQTPGRINKYKQINLEINDSILTQENLELRIPAFSEIIGLIVTSPKVTGSRQPVSINERISYSDGSNRLAQFFNLFDNDMQMVDDFLKDKFWNDIFISLTNNTKVEGDTITFNEMYSQCLELMKQEEIMTTTKDKGRHNEENLRLGLTGILQRLIQLKVFLTGYNLKCRTCSSKIWYSLAEINDSVICKGCGKHNYFQAENPVAYKLNHLIKNNIGMTDINGRFVYDGNITAIRTLLYIYQKAVNSFTFIPQVNIYGCPVSQKPKTDLDIVAMSMGSLYIGECKHNSKFFTADKNKSLNNLLEIAGTMRPDKIIISCTEDENDKLKKAADYLRHGMGKWPRPIDVISYRVPAPTNFWMNL
jgi:hypothetical protein